MPTNEAACCLNCAHLRGDPSHYDAYCAQGNDLVERGGIDFVRCFAYRPNGGKQKSEKPRVEPDKKEEARKENEDGPETHPTPWKINVHEDTGTVVLLDADGCEVVCISDCLRDRAIASAQMLADMALERDQLRVSMRRSKPPLGVMPRFVFEERRAANILEGMERYVANGMAVPAEWRKELDEILDRMEGRLATRSRLEEFIAHMEVQRNDNAETAEVELSGNLKGNAANPEPAGNTATLREALEQIKRMAQWGGSDFGNPVVRGLLDTLNSIRDVASVALGREEDNG